MENKEKEKDEVLQSSNGKNSNEEDKALIVFNNGSNQNPDKKTSKKENISQRKTRTNNLKGRQKNEIISMEDEKDEDMAIFWDDPRYAEGGELVASWTF